MTQVTLTDVYDTKLDHQKMTISQMYRYIIKNNLVEDDQNMFFGQEGVPVGDLLASIQGMKNG